MAVKQHPVMTVYRGPVAPFVARKVGAGRKWGIFGHRPNVSARVLERKADALFETKREAEQAMRDVGLI